MEFEGLWGSFAACCKAEAAATRTGSLLAEGPLHDTHIAHKSHTNHTQTRRHAPVAGSSLGCAVKLVCGQPPTRTRPSVSSSPSQVRRSA